jgi:cytochrome c553
VNTGYDLTTSHHHRQEVIDVERTKPKSPGHHAKSWIGLCLISVSSLSHADMGNSLGQRIAEQGVGNIPSCAVCHGMQGEGDKTAGYPRLAGMSAAYLLNQLNHYAIGTRANQAMQMYSRNLTLSQRRAVATFYAAKPGLSPQTLITQPDRITQGTKLLTHNDWSREIPSCFSCHGDKGAGTDLIPAIADQPARYIITQLNHWRAGARPVEAGDPMAIISRNMSPIEISDIAQYLAHDVPKHP